MLGTYPGVSLELRWPTTAPSTSASPAARSAPSGRASARPAAPGTPWSRRSQPARPARWRRPSGAKARGLAFEGLESETRRPAAHRHRRGGIRPGLRRRRGAGLGDPAGAAIPASASPPCCCRSRPRRRCAGARCAYISGEEAVEQIRARAQRMGLADAPVQLAAETSLRDILDGLKREAFDLVVIDSIQTLWSDAHEAGPGLGHPGARLRRRAGAAGQEARHRRHPGRPRHQGRPDRRPARGRAHGRRRALLRGRARLSVPHPARRQEPLRRHRRDRRLRDGRRRPAPR